LILKSKFNIDTACGTLQAAENGKIKSAALKKGEQAIQSVLLFTCSS
jgi:hypothetical protein